MCATIWSTLLEHRKFSVWPDLVAQESVREKCCVAVVVLVFGCGGGGGLKNKIMFVFP